MFIYSSESNAIRSRNRSAQTPALAVLYRDGIVFYLVTFLTMLGALLVSGTDNSSEYTGAHLDLGLGSRVKTLGRHDAIRSMDGVPSLLFSIVT